MKIKDNSGMSNGNTVDNMNSENVRNVEDSEGIKMDKEENMKVQGNVSDLMEPVEGIRKTTMEEDFSELYGEEINTLRGVSRKVFDLGKGRRQAGGCSPATSGAPA